MVRGGYATPGSIGCSGAPPISKAPELGVHASSLTLTTDCELGFDGAILCKVFCSAGSGINRWVINVRFSSGKFNPMK
jgi:hypothetical protein